MIKALTFDLFGTILDLEKSTKPSIKNILDNNKSGVLHLVMGQFSFEMQYLLSDYIDGTISLAELLNGYN